MSCRDITIPHQDVLWQKARRALTAGLQAIKLGNTQAQEMRMDDDEQGGTVSAIRNLHSNCYSRGYKITKLGKYCKDVPVYIASESVDRKSVV